MADINGKQNIQTDDAGDVQSQIVDSTTPSQGMTVNATGEAHVLSHGFNGSTNVPIPIDAGSGAVQVDIVDATGITVDVDIEQYPDNEVVGAAKKGNLILGTDGANYQILSVDSAGVLNVATQAPVQVSADGNANTALNPLFVETVNSATTGDDIHVFGTTADVANGATHTTSHTVNVGKTFCLTQVQADCSGKCKVEVQVNGSTVDVRFVDVAAPGAVIPYPTPIKVPTGQDVDVIVTNRSGSQDLYASINGVEM